MSKIKSRISFCILLLTCLLTLTGCWDNTDITDLSLVTSGGVDKIADGRIEFTVEIPKASLTRLGQGQAGGGGEKAVTVVSIQGDTVFVAGRSMIEKLSKRLFPSKNDLVLVGESLALDGIAEALDFVERDPEANMTALMLLVKGAPVKKIMEAESEQEKIPSQHIFKSITINQQSFGSSKEARIIDVLREVSLPGIDTLLPVIEILEDRDSLKVENMLISGSAAFNGDKLAGYLDNVETRGWLLVENKAEVSIFPIPSPFNQDKWVSFEMVDSFCKKDVQFINGKPKFIINLKVNGNIGQSGELIDLTQPATKGALEEKAAEVIRGEIESTLLKAQKYRSDIFGFGVYLHKRHLAKWKEFEKDWQGTFSEAPYEIQVEVKLRESGYIRKSPVPK